MSNKFYISDWHYGHTNALRFDNRPFQTIEEMNAELIRRWNEKVAPGDVVYVLGDMFWCKTTDAIEVIKQLNGTKILIKGNHDRVKDLVFARCFAKIIEYEEVEDNGDKIVLCHYPISCFKNHLYGSLHFYGHVHTSIEHDMMLDTRYLFEKVHNQRCKMYNVGAMLPYMDYTPRTKEEILRDGEEYFQMYIKRKEDNNGEEKAENLT